MPSRLFLDCTSIGGRVIYLRLLGGAVIERDGALLAGSVMQRRRVALLALLASAPPSGMSRERLAAFLFPEAEASRAHRALSDALHAVRKALGRGVIVSAGDSLALSSAAIESDVAVFLRHLSAGELEAAVGTYQGPFLDGFFVPDTLELERWIEDERARLASLHAEALESLAVTAERDDSRAGAIRWWRSLAAHDPHNSRVAMRLAGAMAAADDPAGAVRQLQEHVIRLRDELDVEPGVDVCALIEQLQASSAAAAADPVAERPALGEHTAEPSRRPPAASRDVRGGTPDNRQRRVWWIATAALAALIPLAMWRGAPNATVGGALVHLDPEARALYLRGRQAWSLRTREGLDQAVVYFRQATEREPDYAEAYAGMADAYVLLGLLGFRPGAAMFPKGKAAALAAIELDSLLASAYAPLGQALIWEHDWAASERAFRRAIQLAPSYATAHQWYGILLVTLGRIGEAVDETRRAHELDPLSRQISNTYGMYLHYAGDSRAALRHYRTVLEAEPDSTWVRQNPWLLSNASRVYAANGLYDDAQRLLGTALTLAPRHPRLLFDVATLYVAMGQPERAIQTYDVADTTSGLYAYFRGAVFASMGLRDSAFAWFDRETEWGPSPVGELRMDPRLAPIRTDPRYLALLRRLRLIG